MRFELLAVALAALIVLVVFVGNERAIYFPRFDFVGSSSVPIAFDAHSAVFYIPLTACGASSRVAIVDTGSRHVVLTDAPQTCPTTDGPRLSYGSSVIDTVRSVDTVDVQLGTSVRHRSGVYFVRASVSGHEDPIVGLAPGNDLGITHFRLDLTSVGGGLLTINPSMSGGGVQLRTSSSTIFYECPVDVGGGRFYRAIFDTGSSDVYGDETLAEGTKVHVTTTTENAVLGTFTVSRTYTSAPGTITLGSPFFAGRCVDFAPGLLRITNSTLHDTSP